MPALYFCKKSSVIFILISDDIIIAINRIVNSAV